MKSNDLLELFPELHAVKPNPPNLILNVSASISFNSVDSNRKK